MSVVCQRSGRAGEVLRTRGSYTCVMDTIRYISIAEAAGRLGMTLAEVEGLVVEGVLEARETESGKAVAEDDVADREMLMLNQSS